MMRRIQTTAVLAASCLALLAGGCGDNTDPVSGGQVEADTSGGGDTSIADTANTGGIDSTGEDTKGDTTANPDTGGDVVVSCPGGAGCDCKNDDACFSGHCIEQQGKKVCAATCNEDSDCGDTGTCVEIQGTGSDKDKICALRHGNICDPCETNESCKDLGAPNGACVDRGDAGAFCATPCENSTQCPADYVCETSTDVTGNTAKRCVLPVGQVCECGPGALQKEAATSCLVPHSNGGKCKGLRKCLPASAPGAPDGGGLTACSAPEPATETCDGVDNDCNGTTDDNTCDDGNACTTDSCDGSKGCIHIDASDTPCDADGSVCTENDVCKSGTCTPGAAKVCDDGNPCTADVCDPKTGCQSTPSSGEPCNADDNPCTVGDVCKEGLCASGAQKSCDSGDVCVLGKCEISTGTCKYSNKDAEPCNDGNPCTTNEKCDGDACKGAAVDCNDGNSCTADSCDPSSGCTHKATPGPCDDGSKCTTSDACADGTCVGLALNVTESCDDGDDCTIDACDANKGCTHAPQSNKPCEDGNICTVGDTCQSGKCVSGENTCGCNSDADCASKEDGNLCNGTMYCDTSAQPFQCKVKASTIVACDESVNNDCQTNACNPKNGKCELTQAIDGKPCDADGSVCTKDDVCKSGNCLVGAGVSCDDGNACTDDSCDPKSGCDFKPNTNPCDADGDACTVADVCTSGTCVAGKKKDCDDGEFCTDDLCAKDTGKCSSKPRVDACDDDNACTLNDACGVEPTTKLYTCVGGSNLECNDKNPCTQDQCDAKKGCSFTAVADGAGCEDGDACTAGDICKSGTCVGEKFDPKVKCDDGNPCTIDTCSTEKGCTQLPDDAAVCDDGNACTKNDFCKDGKCNSGVNTCGCNSDSDCAGSEDGNLCNGTLYCDKSAQPFQCKVNPGTVVTCDTSLNSTCQKNLCDPKVGKCGLVKETDGTPCQADDNVCTSGDACSDGQCKPGAVLDCDDKSACTSDSCDPKNGCVNTPLAGPCNDGDACTELDSCQGGVCKGSAFNEKTKCNDDNDCTLDVCDQKDGCQNKPLDQKACDDGNACTQNDTCQTGKCVGGTNTCACTTDSDCVAKEDGDLCNGTLFCDTDKQCKLNPASIVTCDTSTDNFCKKTACVAKTGKCESDIKADATPCDADGSLCTTKDACASGACKPGSLLPCDDNNPCTADSCDPKTGCVHTAQSGDCDADGDACTQNDTCEAGKCVAGKALSCDDSNPCTADSCDKQTGKCVYKELIQSCSDDNACTSGDVCGKDSGGAWTCLSGKAVTCADGNVCTEDVCDKTKGCSNPVNTNLSEPCYTFDPKTRGKGECKDGVQLCQQDASLGTCKGDKGPAGEVCDGKDNNCDGVTDEGCAPTAFQARDMNYSLKHSTQSSGVQAVVGASPVGGDAAAAQGGKFGAKFGFLAWIQAIFGK